jgi:hypothetical protein
MSGIVAQHLGAGILTDMNIADLLTDRTSSIAFAA